MRRIAGLASWTALLALGLVGAACSDDDAAKLSATVQQAVTDDQDKPCWTNIGGDPLASDYPLPPCAEPSPDLVSGVDRLRVVLDYGVELDHSQPAPTPKLTLIVDGKKDQILDPVVNSVAGNPRFALFEFQVPPGRELRLEVNAASGYDASLDTVYRLTPPPPPSLELTVTECGATPSCTLAGGVGSVEAVVTLGSAQAQTVIVRSTLDNVPDRMAIELTAETPDGAGNLTGSTTLVVPKSREGAHWALVAQLGAVKSNTQTIAMVKPDITITPICGEPCTVKVGSDFGVKVGAPKGLVATQANLQTSLDGVPAVVSKMIDLDQEDVGKGIVFGLTTLKAASAGSLQLDANIGGYYAPSAVVTVTK